MIVKIKNLYSTLTYAEKKVADVILKDNIAITKSKVSEIANMANVAPSAVIRFCKKIGVDGLVELKKSLIEEFTKEENQVEQLLPISVNDSTKDIFCKTFKFGVITLNDTLNMLDFEDIEKIIKKILTAKRVVFFGVGTSSVIAIDAHYRFSQMGITSSYCSDILFMDVTASNMTKEDLAIYISHSGQTKATVNAMRKAKKAGAITVAISSFTSSVLAAESDYKIITFSDEKNYPIEAVSAGMAHKCIIDAIMMSVANFKYTDLPKYVKARNDALKNIRY